MEALNSGSDTLQHRGAFSLRIQRNNSNCDFGASLDGGLSSLLPVYVQDAVEFRRLVSAQMHAQTWGQMGAGDFVALGCGGITEAPEIQFHITLQTICLAQLPVSGVTFHGTQPTS